MRVIMCCNKCEEKVREELAEVYGVQGIFTDQARSEVVVYGFADTHDVLKKARKVDKRADIMSTDSFTLHHSRHGHRHNKIHHKHDQYHHGYDRSHSTYPVETISSPRYNSSFNQASSGYGSRSIYNDRDYRHGYGQEPEFRSLHDGYRSESDVYRHQQYRDTYRPQYLEHHRNMYDEYRPEHDVHRYRHHGYRPSQSYPPSYVDERDYRNSPYPEAVMNPDHLQQLDYY